MLQPQELVLQTVQVANERRKAGNRKREHRSKSVLLGKILCWRVNEQNQSTFEETEAQEANVETDEISKVTFVRFNFVM